MSVILMKNHTGQLRAHLPKEYALLSIFLEDAIGDAMTPCRIILEALYTCYHENHMNVLNFSTQTMQYTLEIHLQEVMIKRNPRGKQISHPASSLLLKNTLLKKIVQLWLDQLEIDQLGVMTSALDQEM